MTVSMDTKEILKIDLERNHPEVSFEDAYAQYQRLLDVGFKEFKTDTAIFLYIPEGDAVRYHTVNAGSMKELAQGIEDFKKTLTDYKTAYTPLTNPKLEGLVKRYFRKCSKVINGNAVCDLRKTNGLG